MVLKVIKKILLTICVFIVVINTIFTFQRLIFDENLPKIFGFSQAIVTSNSMKPSIEKGDFLIFKEQKSYEKGDVVIFSENDYYVTHRIVDSTSEGFVTKGDNNNTNDKLVLNQDNIEGLHILTIPFLGYVIEFITSFTGILVILMVILVFILVKKIDIKSKNIKNLSLIIAGILSISAAVVSAKYIMDIIRFDDAKVATVVMDGNLVEGLNIVLQNIKPGDVRVYDFSIVNYSGDIISEVKQDYNIIIETTSNLPLEFELITVNDKGYEYANDFVYEESDYIAKNGVFGNEEKEEHEYQLKVTYKVENANTTYIDEIDVISLVIDSIQKVN